MMRSKKLVLYLILICVLSGCGGKATAFTSATAKTPGSETSTLNVWCFQAGKADAFLFWNETGAVLIDTGESGFGKTILEKLAELDIKRLDYLLITHFDKDHVGGAKKLLSGIPVGTVLQSNSPKEGAEAYEKYLAALESCGLEPVTVRQTMSFSLGETVFTVNPPEKDSYPQDESNNSSLIVTVSHGNHRLLFCGDAEDLRTEEFLETKPGRFDFVKLPHHGKYQKTLRELLNETRPDYALITSSEEEPEEPETMELLSEFSVEALLTRNGPIQIICTADGLTAKIAR